LSSAAGIDSSTSRIDFGAAAICSAITSTGPSARKGGIPVSPS
jgi:hypothetical protein